MSKFTAFYRLVHIHPLQELGLLLVLSNIGGEWILVQMNLYLQTALEILSAPLITYSTRVYLLFLYVIFIY